MKENGDAFDKPSHQLESQHKSLEEVENEEDEDLNNEGNEVSFVSACAGGSMGNTKVSTYIIYLCGYINMTQLYFIVSIDNEYQGLKFNFFIGKERKYHRLCSLHNI